MITKQSYPPNCGANCSDRWLAEVRENGWIIDRSRHDNKQAAEAWLERHGAELEK